MSLTKIKTIFESLTSCDTWSIQLLKIKKSKRNGTSYIGRDITLKPNGKLHEFINEISTRYTNSKNGILISYSDVTNYDGSAISTTIYKLAVDNPIINEEYNTLITAIADPDNELDPFVFLPQAYLLKGIVKIDDEEYPVKLISMQRPVTNLKHKFFNDNGTFRELTDKVLSLKPIVDVVIIGDYIYLLTLSGENLFNMERSYKTVCSEKIEDIKTCNILANADIFSNIASTGHNPRRFISFKESRLEKIKDKKYRIKMAKKFSIPLSGDKFDTTKDGVSEKVVKLLCNKGMLDPFEDTPVEVAGSKQWV